MSDSKTIDTGTLAYESENGNQEDELTSHDAVEGNNGGDESVIDLDTNNQEDSKDGDDGDEDDDGAKEKERALEDDNDDLKTEKNEEDSDCASVTTASVTSVTSGSVLSAPGTPPSTWQPSAVQRYIGLHDWNGSENYDFIAVHGIRDDCRAAWLTADGYTWLHRFFKDLDPRHIDFSYEIDEFATIYDVGGIGVEARKLIDEYVDLRLQLPEDETHRPVIWIGHDIGGTILKQALIYAADVAINHREGESEDIFRKRQAILRNLPYLTTGLAWFGCPHRTRSISDLEDEIYHLLSLPGPRVYNGIHGKVKDLAQQVNSINSNFLETKLFTHAVSVNTFHLEPLALSEQQSGVFLESREAGSVISEKSQADTYLPTVEEPEDSTTAAQSNERYIHLDQSEENFNGSVEEPIGSKQNDESVETVKEDHTVEKKAVLETQVTEDVPLGSPTIAPTTRDLWGARILEPSDPGHAAHPVPFRPYTLTANHIFELPLTSIQVEENHQDLVRGKHSEQNTDKPWIPKLLPPWNTSGLHLDVNSTLFEDQSIFFALAPPTQMSDFGGFKDYHNNKRHPTVDWILGHQTFENFNKSTGPMMIYIHGGPNTTTNLSKLFQNLYTANDEQQAYATVQKSTYYFQFRRHDSRYNTLQSMLVSVLNDTSWRFWEPDNEKALSINFRHLWNEQSFTLDTLTDMFRRQRRRKALESMTLFLSHFEDCIDEDRLEFLMAIQKWEEWYGQSFRVIVSTRLPDDALKNILPEASIINLEEAPEPPVEVWLDENPKVDVERAMKGLLKRRPVFNSLREATKKLFEECRAEPELGRIALTWLSNHRPSGSKRKIEKVVQEMSPITPQNLIKAFVSTLAQDKKIWAARVFCWIKYAAEPLTLEILAEGLAFMTSPEDASIEDIDYEMVKNELQQVFAGIVVFDGRDIRLCQHSFYDVHDFGKDSLTEDLKGTIHGQIAGVCLRYLMLPEIQRDLAALSTTGAGSSLDSIPLRVPRSSLLAYAVRFWATHYKLGDKERTEKLAVDFFERKEIRNAWAEAHHYLSNPYTRLHRRYLSPLPYMAMLGLDDLVSRQIDLDKATPLFNKDCWLGIVEAARCGQKTTLSRLFEHAQVERSALLEAMDWATTIEKKSGVLDMLLGISQKAGIVPYTQMIIRRAASHGHVRLMAMILSNMEEIKRNSEGIFEDWMEEVFPIASSTGQREVLKLLLDHNFDVEFVDQGAKAIHRAVWLGDPHTVQLIIDAHADVNARNSFEETPLQTAINCKLPRALEVLIKAGADINPGDPESDSDDVLLRQPIVQAAYLEFTEGVRMLLSASKDPLKDSQGSRALYFAVQSGNLDICRMLLEKGANPNNNRGGTPYMLRMAVEYRKPDLVRLLLDHSANVNSLEEDVPIVNTPLIQAMAANPVSMDIIQLLVDAKADVNLVSQKPGSQSPLYYATYNRNDARIIKLLLENDADLHWKNSSGQTPLHAANDNPELLRILLEHGAAEDINIMSETFGTVLTQACSGNFPESVEIILQQKDPAPQLEVAIAGGWTPLFLACSYRRVESARMLIEAGADMTKRLRSGTLLIGICLSGDTPEQITELVLDKKIDLSLVNEDGLSALHYVERKTPLYLVKLLIKRGAPIDGADNAGYTPLAQAVRVDNIPVARYLISKKAKVNVYSPHFGSLLHLACTGASLKMVKLLVKAKASITAVDPDYGRSLLYTALSRSIGDKEILAKYLLDDVGVKVDAKGGRFWYPIFEAALNSLAILQHVIRNGANVNVVDDLGRSPLHVASGWLDTNLDLSVNITELVNAGADLYAKDKLNRMPLHFAAGSGDVENLRAMLDHLGKDFDINAEDCDGWTPLMWACRGTTWDHREAVRILVEDHRADIKHKSRRGDWWALKLAYHYDWSPVDRQILNNVPDDELELDADLATCEVGFEHSGIECDSCLTIPIRGVQWRCTQCTHSISLCQKCYIHVDKIHSNHADVFKEVNHDTFTDSGSEPVSTKEEEEASGTDGESDEGDEDSDNAESDSEDESDG